MVKSGKFIGVPGAGGDHNLVQLAKVNRLAKFIRFAGRWAESELMIERLRASSRSPQVLPADPVVPASHA
jgi:hypothetical protein